MKIFESLFDVIYLSVLVALGVRLLLEKTKGANLFGIMAIVLGLGDGFHLLPRVISHLSPGGFEAHAAALSWGQFVTSITMTIFYVLYYHYYRLQSNDTDNSKKWIIYGLAALRIGLVLLPQNNWGTFEGNYMFGIYRNIPFLIMGILLVVYSYKKKEMHAFNHMWLLILLSFLFYVPVVLFSKTVPAIGALMMPKTVAYLLIVWMGFKYFVSDFRANNLFANSITILIMGLIGGVFYREFTKFYGFTDATHLGKVHVHTLVLGFVVSLLLYLLAKDMGDAKSLKKPYAIYLAGLTFTIANMVVIGIYEVVREGSDVIVRAAIDGTSGIGHIVLAVGIVWMFVRTYNLKISE
ncbi:DUF2871 domain-containing protein [Finegoldia magna]|uniref:DUF2871 domain-containing protein n=1 Tax=Finegoldia magna TaxID=1260 RepID=UPI0028FF8567|nr:DUF2871 domain-containing protein [Finegoldia magna]MDU1580328.1 DUF2871 domain-containing protein [Finegoldia magna]MDU1601170.1 DUF2871 domain-containing protein [Finegoldia magna]